MKSRACSSCLRSAACQARLKQPRAAILSTRRFAAIAARPSAAAKPEASKQPSALDRDASDIPALQAHLRDYLSVQSRIAKAASTYTIYGVTESLLAICAQQARYRVTRPKDEEVEEVPTTADGEELGQGEGWWIEDLGLPATFSTWSQVTMLHMYLLTARFRCIDSAKEATEWQRYLLDHFSHEAEKHMIMNHNLQSRMLRNRYLKDIYLQWRGLLAAYDEGLAKGDAVLAAAVWRNVFKAREDVDPRDLACVVSYMRRILRQLESISTQELMSGVVTFPNPTDEYAVVEVKSPAMDQPLDATS